MRDRAAIYLPSTMGGAKRDLVRRFGLSIGGGVATSVEGLERLHPEMVPVICCAGELAGLVARWREQGRTFLYWDRGYIKRLEYYRWHVNAFQMQSVRDVPQDRWNSLKVSYKAWAKNGRHIVVATTGPEYAKLHGSGDWLAKTLATIKASTDRPVVVRNKGAAVPLAQDLKDAHCLVTHGSNAAIEAAILGCPVFVDQSSAAALVGQTDLKNIETPVYPDREPWVRSLAHSQFTEAEWFDGTLWRLIQ